MDSQWRGSGRDCRQRRRGLNVHKNQTPFSQSIPRNQGDKAQNQRSGGGFLLKNDVHGSPFMELIGKKMLHTLTCVCI